MAAVIRELEANDAAGLVACFERCYGRSYPNTDFYDAEVLVERLATGHLRGVVAVDDSGTIVGHTALTFRDPGARAPEAGNTVVDPAARGQGLLRRLGGALAALCRDAGGCGYVHYPTAAHGTMQRAAAESGGIETGVMLGYIPAETDYVDIEGVDGPIAATIVYQPLGDAPERAVVLPDRYAAVLDRCYQAAGIDRRVAPAEPPDGPSAVVATEVPTRGLIHVRVDALGRDLAARVTSAIARSGLAAGGDGPPLAHVDLPLGDPGVDAAVEELLTAGFVYCGLLPEFSAGGDLLRLQRLRDLTPEIRRPALANADGQRLLALIDGELASRS